MENKDIEVGGEYEFKLRMKVIKIEMNDDDVIFASGTVAVKVPYEEGYTTHHYNLEHIPICQDFRE